MPEVLHTILFVEDEHCGYSSRCGKLWNDYHILSISSLQDVLTFPRNHLPKLVIVDVVHYGYDGLQQCSESLYDIRIPIIALIGENTVEGCIKALHAGAHDVLVHPFAAEQLHQTMSLQLQRSINNDHFIQEQLQTLAMKIAYALPHEFRTPLNSLLGFISLLRDPDITIEQGEIPFIFESLDSSARRLYRIAEKFLLYAELERITSSTNGPIEGFVTYSAGEIIHDVAMETAMGFGRTADMTVPITALSMPVVVKGQYLRFMIAELVSNACKFSAQSTPIHVTIHEQNHTCTIQVQDRGRGMSAENVASIMAFNQFEREQYEQQGLGFGLAIIKKIAHLYNGEFILQSSPDVGSAITVVLPLYTIPAEHDPTTTTIQYITMSPR